MSASSTSIWGNDRLRVALVLDHTGSMTEGSPNSKISALKTATQLQAAASTDGDVYVSVIPFAKDVNAGAGNYNADWIDWTTWDTNNGGNVKTGRTCTPASSSC